MRATAPIAALVTAAVLAAGATARGDAPPPTKTTGVLTVAIELGNPGFAEGTIGNPHGFSVDLRIRYVDYPFPQLFVPARSRTTSRSSS
jgi:hypothetical protein